jgi:hypothetical protein
MLEGCGSNVRHENHAPNSGGYARSADFDNDMLSDPAAMADHNSMMM